MAKRLGVKCVLSCSLMSTACLEGDESSPSEVEISIEDEGVFEVAATDAAVQALVEHEDAATRVVALEPELIADTPFGGRMAFFVDPNDGTVTVMEKGRIGDPSVSRHPEMENASALELFLAATSGGEEPPAFLVRDYRILHGIADDMAVDALSPSSLGRFDLTADVIPEAAYDDCDGNACFLFGWDADYCAFNVPANQTRNWIISANDNGSNPNARMDTYACHLGTASVNVEIGYRADSGEDCSGFTALYYTLNTGGFPVIDDHEYAHTSYSGSYPRHWYLTKSTTTNGTTDLWLATNVDCP